ncbi:MAG: FliH/SctL family protein, partial [Planctomycetota bacterium]
SIALNISRQLLQQELQDESSRRRVLQHWMRTALESLHCPTNLQILVHPDDLLLAEQVLAHIATHLPFANQAELVADKSCELGDCIVHSELGQVDARLEAQLQHLAEELA